MQRLPAAALAMTLALLPGAPAHAADDASPDWTSPPPAAALTDAAVNAGSRVILDELLRRRDPTTNWEPAERRPGESPQSGGYTALAVLTLLRSGISHQDPRLADAVAWLRTVNAEGTYAVAVRCLVWARLPESFRPELERDVAWLVAGLSRRSNGWDYRQQPNSGRRDNSISQMAALALWTAARRGVDVEPEIWRRVEQGFLEAQGADGGWNYDGAGAPRGSMTAAGVATLLITQDMLHRGASVRLGRPMPETARRNRDAIGRGLAWMDRHFTARANPGLDLHYFYYLYAVERLGLASGRARFAGVDWFRAGAAQVLTRLCGVRGGEEAAPTWFVHERHRGAPDAPVVRTDELCFAALFLSRGRTPVAFAKLDDGSTRWNNRPRDLATLVDWLGETTEGELGWQTLSIDDDPATWSRAPILVIASDRPPTWLTAGGPEATARRGRVRRFLADGGTVLALSEGRNRPFAAAVTAAADELFPGATWRSLGADHPLWSALFRLDGRPPRIRALSNGVREVIVLVEEDWPAIFQERRLRTRPPWQAAANLWAVATDSGEAPPVLGDGEAPSPPVVRRGTLVHLEHDGRWNPEPGAPDRLRAAAAAEGTALDVAVRTIETLTDAPVPALALLAGTDPVPFTDAQLDALRAFAARGGTILVESTGGRGAFAADLERRLVARLGRPATPLLDHPLATGRGIPGATPLGRVRFRGRGPDTPDLVRLRVIELDGRPAFLFSDDDLQHALLDRPASTVRGYRPDTARRLFLNVLAWSAQPPGAQRAPRARPTDE